MNKHDNGEIQSSKGNLGQVDFNSSSEVAYAFGIRGKAKREKAKKEKYQAIELAITDATDVKEKEALRLLLEEEIENDQKQEQYVKQFNYLSLILLTIVGLILVFVLINSY